MKLIIKKLIIRKGITIDKMLIWKLHVLQMEVDLGLCHLFCIFKKYLIFFKVLASVDDESGERFHILSPKYCRKM